MTTNVAWSTALCLDYKLAADVAGERTTDEWTKYVAKRKGMKTDQLAKVYAVWMAYALDDPNRGADPSGPESGEIGYLEAEC